MDVLSLLRLLVRHWRVTVPAVLLTLVAVIAVAKVSAPTYRSTGSIVLLSPPEPPDVGAPGGQPTAANQNPYARFGDLSIMADILARIAADDTTSAKLTSQGVTKYEVTANRFSRGPVVEVTGEESTAGAAIESAERVLDEIDAALADLQEAQGIDPEYFITSALVQPPSTASAVYGSTLRTAIAAMLVGGLCTLGLALLTEVLAQRRSARRAAPPGAVADPRATGPDVPVAGSNGSTPVEPVPPHSTAPDAAAERLNGSPATDSVPDRPDPDVPQAPSDGSRGVSPESAGAAGRVEAAGWATTCDSPAVIRAEQPFEGMPAGSDGQPTGGKLVPTKRRGSRRSPRRNASLGSPAGDGRSQPTSDRRS